MARGGETQEAKLSTGQHRVADGLGAIGGAGQGAASFTPGPWSLGFFGGGAFDTFQIKGPAARLLFNVQQSPRDGGDRLSNARMIAAAPDMLAALKLFSDAAYAARDAFNGAGLPCPASIMLAAEKARSALSKATGEA